MSFEEEYYERTDLWEKDKFGEADQQRIKILAEKLPQNVKTLLDAGCGNGLFLEYLACMKERSFMRLAGADRSAAALSFVSVEKVQAGIDRLPFMRREFDAVACLEVLEHLPQAEYAGALDELSRIANRYILVSVPNNENLKLTYTQCSKCCCRFNPNYHLRSFNRRALQRLFDGRNFVCRDVFYIYPQKVVPDGVERILRTLGIMKRTLFNKPHAMMASYAICPACGYSPAVPSGETINSAVSSKTLEMTIRSLLRLKPGWRWIGALYERDLGESKVEAGQ